MLSREIYYKRLRKKHNELLLFIENYLELLKVGANVKAEIYYKNMLLAGEAIDILFWEDNERFLITLLTKHDKQKFIKFVLNVLVDKKSLTEARKLVYKGR
jgi:hypothetical protein